MTIGRKHHKVPRSLLRQFAAPDRNDQVFVYNKNGRRSYPSSINDAGAERDFYAVGTGPRRFNWEPAFQLLDDRLAEALRELNTCEDLAEVGETVREDLPVLIATQLLRTQLQRTSAPDLAEKLNSIGEKFDVQELDISDDANRFLHFQRVLGMERLAVVLGTKDFLLLRSTDVLPTLWISDNPVVIHNTFPYGRHGVSAPGVEIYLPISTTRCLALYCPSIGEQIRESLDAAHPRAALSAPLYMDLLNAIERGSAVPIDTAFVSFLNELQIRQSSEYVYSASPDFEAAEMILRNQPELGKIRSLFEIGQPGAPPRRFDRMPSGTFLLLEHGHRHHLLSVIDCSSASGKGGIAVEILDKAKLETLDATAVFDAATLIIDGYEMDHMSSVVLSPRVDVGEDVFLVQHADPGLQALMEALAT